MKLLTRRRPLLLWAGGALWLSVCGRAHPARADTLTIYQLQHSTAEADWKSPYEGQIVSIVGGVLTHTVGFRMTLQDPTLGSAWAGMEIRAFENEEPLGVVRVGDRVDLYDVLVEEFRGGTIPQFKSYSRFQVVSSGNPLPDPVEVPLADLRYPPDRARCEKYEGMLVAVKDVRVGRMDWGKAGDNYQLFSGPDTMWASDYYNLDLAVPPFPTYYVRQGERYARVAGVFQEYLHSAEGWDYYQLLPRAGADYVRSDLYTIRDVQESSELLGWRSPLEGSRINLQALVSAERSPPGWLALFDPLAGPVWAGIFVRDPSGALAHLRVGDEVRLDNVLVAEPDGLTALSFDGESAQSIVSAGNNVPAAGVPAGALSLGAGPEAGEPYEGMLVCDYNRTVLRRGVPEGDSLYYLTAGGDTILATDARNTALAPDSTFFVREGDRLGLVRGLVVERTLPCGSAYVLEPRGADDYYFLAGNHVLSTWGRLKRSFE